jgi:hypothetical protein
MYIVEKRLFTDEIFYQTRFVTVQTSSAEIQQPTGTSKICNHPPATEV